MFETDLLEDSKIYRDKLAISSDKAKNIIDIIKAFSEGKAIQQQSDNGSFFNIYTLHVDKLIENPNVFRIKPEKEYRAFNDFEECWKEMQNHTPFGWIKCNTFINIVNIFDDGICVADEGSSCFYNYDKAFETFKFADNTPFGIKN